MHQGPVATRYAKALFDLAAESQRTASISRELAALVSIYTGNAGLREFLARPSLPRAAKRAAALEIGLRAGLSKLAIDFFGLLAERGRCTHLATIAEKYERRLDADGRRARVTVRVATPLTEDQREGLTMRLAKRLDAETIVMEEVVDSAVLGGFVVAADTIVLDASLRGELDTIRRLLGTAP